MRFALLGCGSVGSVIAKFLTEDFRGAELVVFDKLTEVCRERLTKLGAGDVPVEFADANNAELLANILREYDLVIDALPGYLGINALRACIKAQANLVSVSFMPEDPMEFREEVIDAGVTVVPDAGLAPGISNVLAGRLLWVLDSVDEIGIYVGGLPAELVPPLDYVVTWSATDLIEEYVRPARLISNGEVRFVDPLSAILKVEFKGFGVLEGFYSDGLRTLLHTLKGKVRRAYEVTLRYPGHLSKIKLLCDLGFFSDEELSIGGVSIKPKEFTARVLDKKLRLKGVRDLVLLKVVGLGTRSGETIKIVCKRIETGSEPVSAMAKTTAAPATAAATLVANKMLPAGVVPPEYIGLSNELYNEFTKHLLRRSVKVECSEYPPNK